MGNHAQDYWNDEKVRRCRQQNLIAGRNSNWVDS
jgi:hypothetical protein